MGNRTKVYLSRDAVKWAIGRLQRSHPFVGISFLACKKAGLPVDAMVPMSLGNVTKAHMEEHHRLDPQSIFYFQPFKGGPWVVRKYPSTSLRSINTRTFGLAFIHEQKRWGFHEDYVARIGKVVEDSAGHAPVTLSAAAIWIGKEETWPDDATLSTVIDSFIVKYGITPREIEVLFTRDDAGLSRDSLFGRDPVDLRAFAYEFGPPPDAPGETQGTLASLRLTEIGPARRFDLDFGHRLTLIAGDNGLGKTFLLDAAWWALTGNWAGRQATPVVDSLRKNSAIQFGVRYAGKPTHKKFSSCFDGRSRTWSDVNREEASVQALCLYSRVDGSIAVSDEVRGSLRAGERRSLDVYASDQVWDGKGGEIEGLVRDWANWQMSHDHEDDTDAYSTLVQLLEHLSSDDLGPLAPGAPVRLPGDPRTIPTIRFAYGDVPIVMSSAGVRRILTLAYVVTWTWQEHVIAARQVGREPVRKMVLLIDEVEAHLHPRWQRSVLPALMTVGKLLSREMEMQVIAATHSPLVLSSIETDFSSDADVLYHLALRDADVMLKRLDYQKYGDSSAWLTSPVFELRHARSRQAETAIEKAKKLQLAGEPDPSGVRAVTEELRRCLAPDDPFWPRWMYFAEKAGGGI